MNHGEHQSVPLDTDTPEQRLLRVVKRFGSASNQDIASDLGVSQEAVRQRINRLAQQGLIELHESRGALGRPRRYWQLTAAGHSRFPDSHAQLTVQLIDAAFSLQGEAGVDHLLDAREAAIHERYQQALEGVHRLEEKLEILTRLRNEEGYMARMEPLDDGSGWNLIEDHCPIGAAAGSCAGFCQSELRLFNRILAPQGQAERAEHMQQGARRCAYRITPVS